MSENKPTLHDFYEHVSSDNYDGTPVILEISSRTTKNYKTVIEQSQTPEYRTMTEREINRRLEKLQAHYRVEGSAWEYDDESAPENSNELLIRMKMRPVGVEDL